MVAVRRSQTFLMARMARGASSAELPDTILEARLVFTHCTR